MTNEEKNQKRKEAAGMALAVANQIDLLHDLITTHYEECFEHGGGDGIGLYEIEENTDQYSQLAKSLDRTVEECIEGYKRRS